MHCAPTIYFSGKNAALNPHSYFSPLIRPIQTPLKLSKSLQFEVYTLNWPYPSHMLLCNPVLPRYHDLVLGLWMLLVRHNREIN